MITTYNSPPRCASVAIRRICGSVIMSYGFRKNRAYLVASWRMSFFSRFSIASRFSARSDNASVRLGCDASRSTNGRPEMYTGWNEHLEDYLDFQLTDRLLASGEPDDVRWVGGTWSAPQNRKDSAQALSPRLCDTKDI